MDYSLLMSIHNLDQAARENVRLLNTIKCTRHQLNRLQIKVDQNELNLALTSESLELMSRRQFCCATFSRNKIASVTWRVAQFLNSRATFPNRAALYSIQLCRQNAIK